MNSPVKLDGLVNEVGQVNMMIAPQNGEGHKMARVRSCFLPKLTTQDLALERLNCNESGDEK
jgi:hypothetical protein